MKIQFPVWDNQEKEQHASESTIFYIINKASMVLYVKIKTMTMR